MSIFERSTSYRPFKYEWAVQEELKHRIDMNWNELELKLSDDVTQYNSGGLGTKDVPHEVVKDLVDKLLPLFTEMDANVGDGYAKLLPYVGNNEIRMLLITQAAREVTHARAYAIAAETFGFTNSQWVGFYQYSEMRDKIDLFQQDCGDLSIRKNWLKHYINVFLGEGIALFAAFVSLLNLKRHGVMMGFNVANQWSLTDETDHVRNNMRIANIEFQLLNDDDKAEVIEFTKQQVEAYVSAEHTFVDLLFAEGSQQDLTSEQLKYYISYIGKLRLQQTGWVDVEYFGSNPLPWMDEMLSIGKHQNFFETTVSEYSHKEFDKDDIPDYDKYSLPDHLVVHKEDLNLLNK